MTELLICLLILGIAVVTIGIFVLFAATIADIAIIMFVAGIALIVAIGTWIAIFAGIAVGIVKEIVTHMKNIIHKRLNNVRKRLHKNRRS